MHRRVRNREITGLDPHRHNSRLGQRNVRLRGPFVPAEGECRTTQLRR
jgi:hypothetical protein